MDSYSFTWILLYHCHSLLWGQNFPDVNNVNPFTIVPFLNILQSFFGTISYSLIQQNVPVSPYIFCVCTNSGSTHFFNENQLSFWWSHVLEWTGGKSQRAVTVKDNLVYEWTRKINCFMDRNSKEACLSVLG